MSSPSLRRNEEIPLVDQKVESYDTEDVEVKPEETDIVIKDANGVHCEGEEAKHVVIEGANGATNKSFKSHGTFRSRRGSRNTKEWPTLHDYVERNKNLHNHGYIEFEDTKKHSIGRYIKFSDETEPEVIFTLMTKHWGLQEPKLLISITGGAKTFDIPPRLKKDFQSGLSKVASTPGTWLLSGGTSTGVMKIVGDANKGAINTCVGIATWGIITNRENLIPSDEEIKKYKEGEELSPSMYKMGSYLTEKGAYLDSNHTHFLLVDNGTEGEFRGEIKFRGKFESYIMNYADAGKAPAVLIVLEGGPGTLSTILNTGVNNDIPCILVQGSGRCADLLVYALEFKDKILEYQKSITEGLKERIKSLDLETEIVDESYEMVLTCLKKADLFTVINLESGIDTDDAILTALLKNKTSSPSNYEKVRLTILWDRVDLAESKVLSKMKKWDDGDNNEGDEELQKLMIMSLALNKFEFVKLFLDYGISLRNLLTIEVLQVLYACRLSAPNQSPMKREVKGKWYEELSPDIYRYEFYEELFPSKCCKKERDVKTINLASVKKLAFNLLRNVDKSYLENIIETPENNNFKQPFEQLFIWAVLNNMPEMACLLWPFEDNPIANMLIAAEITKQLRENALRKGAHNAEVQSLEDSLAKYQKISSDLLDTCYRMHPSHTEAVVTVAVEDLLNGMSCLEFAVRTEQQDFVAHSAVQGILNEVWTGPLKSRDVPGWKIFSAIFWPPLITSMEFKSAEELQIMQNKVKKQRDSCHDNENEDEKEKKSLSFLKKMSHYHFHTPFVRFFEHTLGYLLFLMLFAYMVMFEVNSNILTWKEILLITTVFGYLVSEIYQLVHVDAKSSWLKMKIYFLDLWNWFDLSCIALFIVALVLRLTKVSSMCHLFYALDMSLWIVRLIHILYADPVCGPYVVMIKLMLKDLANFLVILVIFLLSYGIAVRAILVPSPDYPQMLILSIFKPFFNIYGEMFFDDPSNNITYFGTRRLKDQPWAEPVALIYLGVYLLIANILLLNLLIAIFKNTYVKVMANASRIWKFNRYDLIVEYAERRSFFCPPVSLIEHLVSFIILCLKPKCRMTKPRTKGLKQKGKRKSHDLHNLEDKCLIEVMRKWDEEAKNTMTTENSIQNKAEFQELFAEQSDMNEDMEKRLNKKFDEKFDTISKQLEKLLASQNN